MKWFLIIVALTSPVAWSDIIVQQGETLQLVDDTINENVIVYGDLVTNEVIVNGNIMLKDGSRLVLIDTDVLGKIKCLGCLALTVTNSDLKDVYIENLTAIYQSSGNVIDNINILNSRAILFDGDEINGDLNITGISDNVAFINTKIHGEIKIEPSQDMQCNVVVIFDSTMYNDIQVKRCVVAAIAGSTNTAKAKILLLDNEAAGVIDNIFSELSRIDVKHNEVTRVRNNTNGIFNIQPGSGFCEVANNNVNKLKGGC